ncbi:MAG: glycosyl hydrolase [Bacteroidota bacterium]
MQTILVGTTKGLLVYQMADQLRPTLPRVHFTGFSVNMVYVDERYHRWWVGVSHRHWGQKLHYSDDRGANWQEVPPPSFEGALMPDGSRAKLRQIWCMQQGGYDQSDVLWLGTDPGGLFRSNDGGETFTLVDSLWNHPSRQKPGQWFGAGSNYPFIHSIVVDPEDSDHIYIAVSCAGVFESIDGGSSWHPRNKGLVAAFLPNPNVEVGHDPHRLLISPSKPNVLWQQNHCGVYYSDNGGKDWKDVSVVGGIPYYGFALAVDEADPSKAWVIPVESDEQRVAPDLQLNVYETVNFGKSWHTRSEGLPQEAVFDIVLRQAFVKRGNLMVFGTTNGNLYYSDQERIYWNQLSAHLTKVNVVVII